MWPEVDADGRTVVFASLTADGYDLFAARIPQPALPPGALPPTSAPGDGQAAPAMPGRGRQRERRSSGFRCRRVLAMENAAAESLDATVRRQWRRRGHWRRDGRLRRPRLPPVQRGGTVEGVRAGGRHHLRRAARELECLVRVQPLDAIPDGLGVVHPRHGRCLDGRVVRDSARSGAQPRALRRRRHPVAPGPACPELARGHGHRSAAPSGGRQACRIDPATGYVPAGR